MNSTLELDAIYIYPTYGSFLAGLPSVEAAINQAQSVAGDLFGGFGGSRPTYVVPPMRRPTRGGRPPEVVPPWCHLAWILGPVLHKDSAKRLLDSSRHNEAEQDGSMLVLIWFADAPSLDWEGQLKDLVWEEHAKNWAF